MHITLVANTAWSMYHFRQALIKSLLQDNHKVTIIAPFDDYAEHLISMGCEFIKIKLKAKSINPIQDLLLTHSLYKIYKKIQPDLIFHYTIKPNIYGSIAAYLAKVKSIAITTGLGYTFINNNLISLIAKSLYKYSLKFAQQVWFLNQDDLNIFLKYKLIAPNKAMLLPSEGIDSDFFAPFAIESISNAQLNILFIGRMLKDKGINEFIQVAKLLKQKYNAQINFYLLGSCDDNNPSAIKLSQIQQWQQQGYITYLGVTKDVRPYIAMSDCIVLPSYGEGIPRTLLEASSMEKPIIATDVAGCKDVIKNNITGLLCKAKDIDTLYNAIETMFNYTNEKRQNMGKQGREYIKQNFEQKIILQIYKKVIKKFYVINDKPI